MRASNYYRTAADILLEHPATDPEMTLLSAGQHDTFAAAAAQLDAPVQAVSIPYEDITLPPTCSSSNDSGAARPTIIYTSGYDSTREESYFVIAAGWQAGVPARDPTDANTPTTGAGFCYGQPAPPPARDDPVRRGARHAVGPGQGVDARAAKGW